MVIHTQKYPVLYESETLKDSYYSPPNIQWFRLIFDLRVEKVNFCTLGLVFVLFPTWIQKFNHKFDFTSLQNSILLLTDGRFEDYGMGVANWTGSRQLFDQQAKKPYSCDLILNQNNHHLSTAARPCVQCSSSKKSWKEKSFDVRDAKADESHMLHYSTRVGGYYETI